MRITRPKGLVVVCLLTCAGWDSAARAQQPSATGEDRQLIEQLLKRVTDLEAEVRDLRARLPKSEAVATAPGADNKNPGAAQESPTPVVMQAQTPGTLPDGVQPTYPDFRLQGFADVQLNTSDLEGATSSFALGQLDLYMTSSLSDRLHFFSELVFEAGHDNGYAIDVERLLLQYTYNDHLNLAAGRFHTSIGYYNTAYHHGSWLQTAVNRPFIFAFEDNGGLLPIHGVGLTASGQIPSGSLGLRYLAEVSNGRDYRNADVVPVQNLIDNDNRKAVNLGMFARPERIAGLQTGFSVYNDALRIDGSARVRQTIVSTHLVYVGSNFETLNEALLIRHSLDGSTLTFDTPAFYTQFARRFGRLWPFVRYEYLNASGRDPLFGTVGRRNGPAFGIRFNFAELAAFKAQYSRTTRRNLDSFNDLRLQVAFTF